MDKEEDKKDRDHNIEKIETESNNPKKEKEKEQDRPKVDTIKWNKVSTNYESQIKKLSTDPSREKVGNIYFSKNDNYIISHTGHPTVYLGFSDEYTEVAIREIRTGTIDNVENVKNLLQRLRILESKNIMKYFGFEEDGGVYYLAAELCECELESYMKNELNAAKKAKAVMDIAKAKAKTEIAKKKAVRDAINVIAATEIAKKKAVRDILRGVQALHTAGVIHGALKPSSIFIDSCNTAKLADYGSIYKLKRSSTAGTQIWEATETHTKESDIQVAGMLVYYILSNGKHPFWDIKDCEDIVAKDLIEWMIDVDPKIRPTIDKVLNHPYFWDEDRKDLVLRRLGDREEVQKYQDFNFPSLNTNITGWKSKMRSWGRIDRNLPDNLVGLLRFLRNKLVHKNGNFTRNFHDNLLMKTVRVMFPEFFICLHRLAYEMEWDY